MKHLTIPIFTAVALLCLPVASRAEEKTKPGPLTAEEASKATEYFIPPAADVFSRLSKVSNVNWGEVAAKISQEDLQGGTAEGATKATKAIYLGLRVADAFIAVQAKDDKLLRQIADVIEKLGADLNVSEPIQKRGKEMRRLVEENKWVQAGTMLATMRGEVISDLKQGKDNDSVVLATMAGWIRGLDVVSDALARQYDAEATKVLRDPELLSYLKKEAEGLSAKTKEQPFVQAFLAKADEMQKLVAIPKEGTMSKENLTTLSQLTNQVVTSVKR
jgi:hypothetical protein